MKESVTASASGSTVSDQKNERLEHTTTQPRTKCALSMATVRGGRPAESQMPAANTAPKTLRASTTSATEFECSRYLMLASMHAPAAMAATSSSAGDATRKAESPDAEQRM